MPQRRKDSPAPREPILIHDQEILAGTKVTLEIPIASLSTGTVLSLPVVVVHGSKPGPTLLVSAAIHGDEINGVEIVRRVLDEVKPRGLSGTLIAVPIVNVFGYLTRSRYLPDRRDLNRSFPGSKKGSLASQIAFLFMTKIVKNCDYGIDLHTGSDGRTNMPQVRCNLHDPVTREFGLAFGAPVMVQSRIRANSLRATAAKMNLPMLVYEAGEAHRFDNWSLEVGVKGVIACMSHLGMLSSELEPQPQETVVAASSSWIRVQRGGVLHHDIQLGDQIQRGQLLGTVTDIYGKKRSSVVSAYEGLVIGMTRTPLVTRGDAVFHIAREEALTPAEEAGEEE
ncbi:MAG: succinylglutamate desuccinylase/aspartoacylase family protein [Fimbriimonadaceae bacterium]|jgi:hypothetical protein|nr:succinylglutamate desuccinylase/aspartoacylase family protein [Fimbriimonadaceae bacterium]